MRGGGVANGFIGMDSLQRKEVVVVTHGSCWKSCYRNLGKRAIRKALIGNYSSLDAEVCETGLETVVDVDDWERQSRTLRDTSFWKGPWRKHPGDPGGLWGLCRRQGKGEGKAASWMRWWLQMTWLSTRLDRPRFDSGLTVRTMLTRSLIAIRFGSK